MPARRTVTKRRTKERVRARADAPASASSGDLDLRSETEAAIRLHRAEIARLEADRKASPRQRQFAAAALNTSLRLLAKLDGAGDITVSQILRSAAWKRVQTVLLEVARQFPGCCEATGKALRELEAQGG